MMIAYGALVLVHIETCVFGAPRASLVSRHYIALDNLRVTPRIPPLLALHSGMLS